MTKSQGNLTNFQQKRQPTEENPEMTQMLELPHKDFKEVIIIMLNEVNIIIIEMNGKLDILSREIEAIKQKQMEILEKNF